MLNKPEAALRAEAVSQILGAENGLARNAFRDALYNHPGAALLAIKRVEVRLKRAKAALRKWARRGR